MAPVPEVHELRTDVVERRLLSALSRSLLLVLLLAVARGVAFGQDTLALSSGDAEGNSIPLNLSLSSPVGSEPAGVQWTLTYAAADVASIDAVAGSSAAAANETIACFAGAGSYTCLLSGMNDEVMQNGVVAVINVTLTSSAVATPISLTNVVGASAAGSPIFMTGAGGTIALSAAAAGGTAAAIPSVQIDMPASGATVSGTATVAGWAIDNVSTVGTAIGSVQVLVDGTPVGAATYGVSRPDVCAAYPGRAGCPNVGFSYSLNTATLAPGSHTITVTATDSASPPDTGSATVTIIVSSGGPVIPSVHIDMPASGATVSGTATVAGWAIDNTSTVGTAIGSVQVLVDGTAVGMATYGVSRPDVCAAYPGRAGCPNVGFSYSLNTATLAPGSHTITVTTTDSASPPDTGSTTVTVIVGSGGPVIPSVQIDMPASSATVSGTATVAGWAIDNISTVGTAISSVQVLVDGTAVGTATYGVSRPDVCTVYPGRSGCPNVGYSYSLNTATLTPGSHTLTVTATDSASPPDTGSESETITVTAGSAGLIPAVVIEAPALNGASKTTSVSLRPASSQSDASIACNPDPNKVGGLDCGVSLAQAAPASGVTVAVRANTPRVQVPAQVSIAAGALSAQFIATVISSDHDAQAQITASVQGASTTATIPITGIRPTSLSCAPQTVQAGGFFTCTVGMNNPNVLQVARLAVSSNSTSFELPSPFTTRPGQAQLSFEVFTTPFAGQQSSAVTVQFGETAVTSPVEVTPATAPILNLPGTQMAAFGKPMSFAVSAVDPGGLPLTLSAANLPPSASFNPATGGFLWTPQAPSSLNQRLGTSSPLEQLEVTFTATNSARISSTGWVTIEADPGLPVITGLRNAASQQSQAVLPKDRVTAQSTSMSCSPGSLASLLGRWLAAGAQPTRNPTGNSTELAGAEVIVNGNPAPVVYASATRVDFLCPEALSGGELEISAQIGGTVTNVVHANQQATLGLFSADGSGQGQAMVTLSGTSLLATPRSYLNNGQPAEPGDTISILATGAGLDAGPALVEVSIGGVSTTADRVQPMTGMAGVYRVDVTVPASVAPGDAVPIVIEVADSSGNAISSNTVTIAVEAPQSAQP